MIIPHAGKQAAELGELVVVRREKGLGARPRLQLFHDGPGKSQPVKSRRPAADLVEQDQAARRAGVEDGGGLGHFDHERGAAARQIIGGADAREDAVKDAKFGPLGGNETAHLRHQRDQRRLAQIGGLAAHVRPRDDEDEVRRGIHVEVVRDEPAALLAADALDDGMAALDNDHLTVVGEFRATVVAVGGQLREASQDVEFGQGSRRLADAPCLGRDPAADLDKEFAFKRLAALVGVENLRFELLQLRRREPLGVHERLLALVIGGNERKVRLRDLEVIAENVVEAHFERGDAGARALAGFDPGDQLLRRTAERAQLVERGVKALANQIAFAERRGRGRMDGGFEQAGEVRELVEAGSEFREPRGFEVPGLNAKGRQAPERFFKSRQVPGVCRFESHPAEQALKVLDFPQPAAQFFTLDGVLQELFDRVPARQNFCLVDRGAENPGAEHTRAKRSGAEIEGVKKRRLARAAEGGLDELQIA